MVPLILGNPHIANGASLAGVCSAWFHFPLQDSDRKGPGSLPVVSREWRDAVVKENGCMRSVGHSFGANAYSNIRNNLATQTTIQT